MNKKAIAISLVTILILLAAIVFLQNNRAENRSVQVESGVQQENIQQTDDAVLQHAKALCLDKLSPEDIKNYMAQYDTEEIDETNWIINIKDSSYFDSIKVLFTQKACFFDVMPVLTTGATSAPLLDYQGYRDQFKEYFDATYDEENSKKYTGEYYMFKQEGKQYYAIFNYDTFNSQLSLTITDDPNLYV
jgi:mRNA-degrading endonuclease HigB of HigAB toxin-antitoxin module